MGKIGIRRCISINYASKAIWWSSRNISQAWDYIKLLSAAFFFFKLEFGIVSLESREWTMLRHYFPSWVSSWLCDPALCCGHDSSQAHAHTGWRFLRPLTVHGDLYSPDHWCSHIIGGTALIVPRLLPRDALDFQVFVFTHKAHGCRRRYGEKKNKTPKV